MQEVYRPWRIKYYSVGYPPARSDGGYPRWGTCPARSNRGTQGGVPPSQGTPPGWTWLGYPPGWGSPALRLDLAGVPPLCVDRQTDGQTRVKTSLVLRTWSVTTIFQSVVNWDLKLNSIDQTSKNCTMCLK